MPRHLAAIMFTDIVGYTELAQTDEKGALKLAKEQQRLVRPILATHAGRKVKSMGDGLLLEFDNALDAVQCGVEFQRVVRERNAETKAGPLRIRIGIHLGDIQRNGTDILGDAVNIASRLEPLAEVGGICISEDVYSQVRNKVPYPIESMGPRNLKGVRAPVHVYRVGLAGASPAGAARTSDLPRIAILPLVNISPDPNDAYFADGLTEEMISTLAQAGGLRVISHTSVNQYRGTTKSVAQIGSELGADHVLEGSVRKAGDQIRIAVQLIDARTDEHRWAQTYDRKLENIFAIQADVAERAAEALKVRLLPAERDAIHESPTSNLAAYQYYLRGLQSHRSITDSGASADRIDRETQHFLERAIKEDPEFSAAHSLLATHLIAVAGMTRDPKEAFARARELVTRALDLSPVSSEAHTAQGNLAMQADQDWPRAEREFQRAIALNPSSSAAHSWYGYLLRTLQRFDEAAKEDRLAIELDPLWVLPWYQLMAGFECTCEWDAALETSTKMLETFGETPGVVFGRAWALSRMGRVREATVLMESLKGQPDLVTRSNRASVLSLLGDHEETRALIADWEAGKIREYASPFGAAERYAVMGETEKALALLERTQREGNTLLWANYLDVEFDVIRDDPRFVALLRELKVPTTISRPYWRAPPSRKG
jgi:adenylate cyclase